MSEQKGVPVPLDLDALEAIIQGPAFKEQLRDLKTKAWLDGDTTMIRTCTRALFAELSLHEPNVLACAMAIQKLLVLARERRSA